MKIKMWLQSGISLWLGAMLIGIAAAKDCTWEFNRPEVLEGWTLDGVIDNGVSNGVWKLSATRGNPFIFTPKVEIDAGNQGLVKIRMRLGKGLQTKGCILFVTEEQQQWDDRMVVLFDCRSHGEFADYEVDMSNNPLWKGKVKQLRFQPLYTQWPLPEPQRKVEIDSFGIVNIAAATGRYGDQANRSTSSPSIAVTFTNTMLAQYVRIENRGSVEFVELEAYDKSKTNVALKKPVNVSDPIWGQHGSLGNDGNTADGGGNTVVMMHAPVVNWWEVDLGKEMPLTHVVIYMRDSARREGRCQLHGASFSILDHERNSVASCQMEVMSNDEQITIPMDKAYFHYRDLYTRFAVKSDPPGNIITHEKGCLRLVVPDPKALANGSIVLSDLEGRTLRTMPLSRGTGDYEIPLHERGYYIITATATYDGGLVLTKKASAAVIGEPLDSQTRLKSIFGIQKEWGLWGREFIELGAGWSWAIIYTHHVEKSSSGYEWSPTYAWRIKNGKWDMSPEVNNVVVFAWLPEFLQSVPSSQRGNCATSPPNDYEEFVRFIKWVTLTIPDFVKYVVPIAEPSWSFKGSPEELAKYHEVIAKAVREVRPDIHILGPMMSPGNSTSIESIKALDKLGLFTHLDGISIHPYVVDWPTPFRSRMPEADFIDFVDEVIRHFASTGRPDYPLYLTEFGWYAGPGGVDELTRTRYSSRAAILLATRPVIKMANFFELGGGGGFSYLNSDGTPRPVCPAMAQTFRWLANCSSGLSTRLAPMLYLAAFKKGNGVGIAIWDTKSDSAINVPIHSIECIQDMMGRKVVSKNGKIMTSPSPLFIDWSDDSLWSCLSSAATAPDVMLIPGKSVEVGDFDEVIMPEIFVRRGATITTAANVEPGEYRLIGKSKGKWRVFNCKISAQK